MSNKFFEQPILNSPYECPNQHWELDGVAEINAEAWATLHSDTSLPFTRSTSGRIAVKVINYLGDEVMKVFRVK